MGMRDIPKRLGQARLQMYLAGVGAWHAQHSKGPMYRNERIEAWCVRCGCGEDLCFVDLLTRQDFVSGRLDRWLQSSELNPLWR